MRGDLSAGRAGENPEISVTHEQLANQINSSREVVSRTLKNMENQNIVRLRRGKITILNQKELTRLRSEDGRDRTRHHRRCGRKTCSRIQ
jgi:DNA-binding transcriptional regulator YhcF (GntR family)